MHVPVSPPSPLRTVHATCTAHGATPVGHFVSGHCSPTSRWCIPQGSHAGPWVPGRANRLWACAMWSGFPGLGLLRPHRHSLGPRRFAAGLPAAPPRSLSHPVGRFPCSRSWTPATSDRWRVPDSPSALCGSPTRSRIRRHSGAAFAPFLALRGYGFCCAWATEGVGCPRQQGRTGDHFPVGSHPLQGDAPEDVSATHRLSLACFQLTGPFRGMLLTSSSGRRRSAPTTQGVPVHSPGTTALPPSSMPRSRFMAHSSAWLASLQRSALVQSR